MTAQLDLFITSEHACSYLPDRSSRNLVADPSVVDQNVYSELARRGFRRSGEYVYQPHCSTCSACRSLRVDCNAFRANRSQRRCLKQNRHITMQKVRAVFEKRHFDLFSRYVVQRHPEGGMADMDADDYLDFIRASWSDSWLYEFYDGKRLISVAVVDHLRDGLSAVYTFFDPDEENRGLGTLAILRLIEEARQTGKSWLYLGYWIADCDKMAYKNRFLPHQVFGDEGWR